MKKLLICLIMALTHGANAQFLENFDDITVVQPPGPGIWTLPSGNWLILENGVGSNFWGLNNPVDAFPALSPPNSAFIRRQNIGSGNTSIDYLVTPLVNLPADAQLRFLARASLAGYQNARLELRMAPATADPTQMSSFTTVLGSWNDDLFIPDGDFVINLDGVTDTSAYFAFVRVSYQQTGAQTGDSFRIDNVRMVSECPQPGIPTIAVSNGNVTASWTSTGTTSQWQIQVVPSNSVLSPNQGIPLETTSNSGIILTNMTQPFNTPLLPNTEYIVYVRSVCEMATSEWVASTPFTTPSTLSVCGGTFSDINGNNGPYLKNTDASVTFCPNVPGEAVTVTFSQFAVYQNSHALYVFEGTNTSSGQILSVNGAGSVPGGLAGGFWGTAEPGPFSSESADGCLTFLFRSDEANQTTGWEATISCAPLTCTRPTGITASAQSPTSAILNWTPSGSETQWEAIAIPCDADQPLPSVTSLGVLANVHPFTMGGLIPNTCYRFFVRAVCGPNDSSTWSEFATVSLPQQAPSCGTFFYDSAGGNDYPDNSDVTTTICPDASGDTVTVTFTEFNIHVNDGLYVYEGNSIAAPQISSGNPGGNIPGGVAGAFWGSIPPGPFTSTSADGCLTFRFRSGVSSSDQGWTATVTCNPLQNYIRLVAFIDLNADGVKQATEPYCGEGQFMVEQNDSGNVTYVTSPSGNYLLFEPNPSNSYDFGLYFDAEAAPYFSTTTAFTNITATAANTTLYFPVTPLTEFTDLGVSINASSATAGETSTRTITFWNDGFETASGMITYTRPPGFTFIGANVPVSPAAYGFIYNFTDLLPSQTRQITVHLHAVPLGQINIGDLVTDTVSISEVPGDYNPYNNTASSTVMILAAYDPNAILEKHGPEIPIDTFSADDFLEYTIHFQNTGNAPATNVRLENVLDGQLDEQSVSMLSSSHGYIMERNGNSLVWKLNGILLPPQSETEEGSKGFVTFKVKMKPGFEAGDMVPATTSIYFDTNPAVVTETFETTFTDALSSGDFEKTEARVYPNPASENVFVSLSDAQIVQKIKVYDILGAKVLEQDFGTSSAIFNVLGLSKGVYVIKIISENNMEFTKKLLIK